MPPLVGGVSTERSLSATGLVISSFLLSDHFSHFSIMELRTLTATYEENSNPPSTFTHMVYLPSVSTTLLRTTWPSLS